MTDAFFNLIGPVIRYVIDLQLKVEQGEHTPLPVVREKIMGRLAEAEQRASVSTQLMHDFELAKYALVYWVDEVLIDSAWEHALAWKQHILEWDIYRERLRADRFFEKAAEAATLAGTDPLEVFFICAALGFRGKYRPKPEDAATEAADKLANFQKWAERAYGRVVAGSSQPERFLPDEPRDAERGPLAPLPGKSYLLAVSILVSITSLVSLLGFLAAVELNR